MSDKSRVHQLWVLGTEYADKSPALSRFYLEKMKLLAERGRIKLPDALSQSFCQFCGSLFLIDNCSVQLKQKAKRGRRRKNKRFASDEGPDSRKEPIKKRATRAKTTNNLRKDSNHVVKLCKICGKRSIAQGFERMRSGSKETSMLIRTPERPAHFTSTPVVGNSSIEQAAQSTRSRERKRQRSRTNTARKLQSILQAEDRRKSTPATPNIRDFLSSL